MQTTITGLLAWTRGLLSRLKQAWIHLTKISGDIADFLKPRGQVEMIARYGKNHPLAGQVAFTRQGRNIITSQQATPYSGRDVLRRILVDSALSGSLAGDIANHTFKYLRLGSGTTTETVNDTALETPIGSSLRAFTSVEFDATNPYVTLIVSYDEDEVNSSIAELSIESEDGDFLARKTITPFTKTTDFTIEVRWQIRL